MACWTSKNDKSCDIWQQISNQLIFFITLSCVVDENPQKWQASEEQLFLFESVWKKKIKGTWWTAPSTPFTPPFSWLRVRHPQLLKKKTSKFQSKTSPCNLRSTFYLRSGRIYCILAANRQIGSNCLLFTQIFFTACQQDPSLPRTHTISALSIQEFQLLDISTLPRHLSLVNTAIK